MNPGIPSSAACQVARESMLDQLEFAGASDQAAFQPTVFHCEACRTWFERARRHVGALDSLPRGDSGQAQLLDGLVVAELNAGRRQERAVAALVSLKRFDVPTELDDRIRDGLLGAIRNAPDELERRVAQELAVGSSPRVERQMSAMARLCAPAELEARVARSLATSKRQDGPPTRRWIAIAAGLLVVLGATALVRQSGLLRGEPYQFRVVHSNSTASLDPLARGMLSAVSGGLYDVPGVAR